MTTIAIDCDEVLAETLDVVLAFHNYKFKWKTIARELMTNYYLYKMPQYNANITETSLFYEPVLDSEHIRDIKPCKWALEKLQERKKAWHTLKIVTWRPLKRKENTIKRVEKYYPEIFDDIIFANHLTSTAKLKSDICKEIWATVMIEDNLDYCIDTAWAGIKSYLIDKPWNREYDKKIHKGIVKVKGWEEIEI